MFQSIQIMKKLLYFLIFTSLLACKREPQVWLISSPSNQEFTQINYDGTTVIPNGRKLTPIGKSIITAPHPFGLTLSHDGNTAITANSGVRPLSITIVRNLQGEPEIQQIPPGPKTDADVLSSVFMGLAVSPDNQKVYVAGGQENKIYIFNLENGESLGYLDCSYQDDSLDYSHGYIGDLVLSKSGNTLYAVDQIGFRVVVIDTDTKLMKSIPVGRYLSGFALLPMKSGSMLPMWVCFSMPPFVPEKATALKSNSSIFLPLASTPLKCERELITIPCMFLDLAIPMRLSRFRCLGWMFRK